MTLRAARVPLERFKSSSVKVQTWEYWERLENECSQVLSIHSLFELVKMAPKDDASLFFKHILQVKSEMNHFPSTLMLPNAFHWSIT